MQEIDFFKTPFFLFKSDKKFAEKISDEIRDILKNKKKVDYINYKGQWKNKIKVNIPNLNFETYSTIGGFLDNKGDDINLENMPSQIKNHLIENIQKIPLPLQIVDLWANITSSNDYNRVHNHCSQADLVFVLYLTKGTLWIQNPHYRLELDRRYNSVGSSISLDFNIGDMIVFPSDIQHWVEPFDGDYDRISIAGNLSIN